jgi:hypothetical protein
MDRPASVGYCVGDWTVYSSWQTPSIKGKRVCIRGAAYDENGVLQGFHTDGTSIPEAFWTVMNLSPFSMPVLLAAIGHDGLYEAQLTDRATCDEMLYKWGLMANVSQAKMNVVWDAVRVGGGVVWGKHTTASISYARNWVQLVDDGADPIWMPLPPGWTLS